MGESNTLPMLPASNKPAYKSLETGMFGKFKFVFMIIFFCKDVVMKSLLSTDCRKSNGFNWFEKRITESRTLSGKAILLKLTWSKTCVLFKKRIKRRFGIEAYFVHHFENSNFFIFWISEQALGFFNSIMINEFKKNPVQ